MGCMCVWVRICKRVAMFAFCTRIWSWSNLHFSFISLCCWDCPYSTRQAARNMTATARRLDNRSTCINHNTQNQSVLIKNSPAILRSCHAAWDMSIVRVIVLETVWILTNINKRCKFSVEGTLLFPSFFSYWQHINLLEYAIVITVTSIWALMVRQWLIAAGS